MGDVKIHLRSGSVDRAGENDVPRIGVAPGQYRSCPENRAAAGTYVESGDLRAVISKHLAAGSDRGLERTAAGACQHGRIAADGGTGKRVTAGEQRAAGEDVDFAAGDHRRLRSCRRGDTQQQRSAADTQAVTPCGGCITDRIIQREGAVAHSSGGADCDGFVECRRTVGDFVGSVILTGGYGDGVGHCRQQSKIIYDDAGCGGIP